MIRTRPNARRALVVHNSREGEQWAFKNDCFQCRWKLSSLAASQRKNVFSEFRALYMDVRRPALFSVTLSRLISGDCCERTTQRSCAPRVCWTVSDGHDNHILGRRDDSPYVHNEKTRFNTFISEEWTRNRWWRRFSVSFSILNLFDFSRKDGKKRIFRNDHSSFVAQTFLHRINETEKQRCPAK